MFNWSRGPNNPVSRRARNPRAAAGIGRVRCIDFIGRESFVKQMIDRVAGSCLFGRLKARLMQVEGFSGEPARTPYPSPTATAPHRGTTYGSTPCHASTPSHLSHGRTNHIAQSNAVLPLDLSAPSGLRASIQLAASSKASGWSLASYQGEEISLA
jgi:hypothetical protein